MGLSMFWLGFLLLLSTGIVANADTTTRNPTNHITRASDGPAADNELDIELLRVGKPLVGVVEEGESRLLHFGVLPRDEKFPDILLYLDALNSDADVDIYCMPYIHTNTAYPPNRISASWKTTKYGDVFISSKGVSYQEAIVKKMRNGKKTKMATFGCAIRSNSKGSLDFQLTLRLSFDERKLNPEQQSALRQIYRDCCSDDKTCHRWVRSEQKEDEKHNQLDEIEFDFCHRSGSLCNSKGEIIRLDLRSYGLKCTLPVEALLKLTTLEVLDLSDNSIHADVGEEVTQLGALQRLRTLSLAHSVIFGEMDVPGFCDKLPKNLHTLDLNGNFMNGKIPTCLFAADRSLEEIYLSDNRFRGYISDLFPSSSPLKALTLSNNELTGTLPSTLGRLESLRVLHLDGNEFNGPIPETFVKMKSLEVLDLSNNRLSSLPSSWSTGWNPPATLRVVKLQNNKLSGNMPARLLRAESLEWLDMSTNSLSGYLFAVTGMFPNMFYFNVSRNDLVGPIPGEFASMGLFGNKTSNGPRHIFDVSFNHLSGLLPEFFYQEETASIVETEIYLEGNRLSCHQWKTLNYIPNFDCKPRTSMDQDGAHGTAHTLSDESEYPTANSANTGRIRGVNDNSGGSSANAIIGTVSGLLAAAVIIGIIVLIVRFKRRRDRRLGLQYGAADEDDSEDDIEDNVPAGDSASPQRPEMM